jgi:hypothetical protein
VSCCEPTCMSSRSTSGTTETTPTSPSHASSASQSRCVAVDIVCAIDRSQAHMRAGSGVVADSGCLVTIGRCALAEKSAYNSPFLFTGIYCRLVMYRLYHPALRLYRCRCCRALHSCTAWAWCTQTSSPRTSSSSHTAGGAVTAQDPCTSTK